MLGRNHHDPFLTGAPWVISENGRLRMWYISGTEWVPGNSGKRSADALLFRSSTPPATMACLADRRPAVTALSQERTRHRRPVVIAADGGYRMIYSARRLGETYRIYSANSADGLSWQRDSLP